MDYCNDAIGKSWKTRDATDEDYAQKICLAYTSVKIHLRYIAPVQVESYPQTWAWAGIEGLPRTGLYCSISLLGLSKKRNGNLWDEAFNESMVNWPKETMSTNESHGDMRNEQFNVGNRTSLKELQCKYPLYITLRWISKFSYVRLLFCQTELPATN